MNPDPAILVVTEDVSNAETIGEILAADFTNVHLSTRSDALVPDHKRLEPAVTVFADDQIERCESQRAKLTPQMLGAAAAPGWCLALCHVKQLRRTYELCRHGTFDDYVLFWPLTHDATRLQMSVHHGLRSRRCANAEPTTADFVDVARLLCTLDDLIEQELPKGATELRLALAAMSKRAVAELETSGTSRSSSMNSRAEYFDAQPGHEPEDLVALRRWFERFAEDLLSYKEPLAQLRQLASRVQPVIMVVDDDPFLRRVIVQALSELPVKVVLACSGSEALETVQDLRPNLILLDIALGDMDGKDLLRALKADSRHRGIPVIMLTGHTDRDTVLACRSAGAIDFLGKPFERRGIVRKVSEALPQFGRPVPG